MKTFKQFVQEDGMGAGAVAAGPTNVVSGGAIDRKSTRLNSSHT